MCYADLSPWVLPHIVAISFGDEPVNAGDTVVHLKVINCAYGSPFVWRLPLVIKEFSWETWIIE